MVDSQNASEWKVEAIYGDKKDQLSASEYHEDTVLRGKPSTAYGVFRCCNVNDSRDLAVIRVIMQ